ncbi:hypothetical protein CCHL11_10404 [Colletotrichum chlorophyti]|uniref:Cyclin-dependent kinase protein n=1 Tax=Colletotrichum chlorophyti TaxID=708187 RepID=A0A1Q8RBH9_9PEZI|nr:hypothetical protein CCHL11_10404 [Colletotrichum chlorophyti]
MDPSSPLKRRALAPLDANVNAMSPTKVHNKTKTPGSPFKSPIKSPMGLKRPLAAVVFDENDVAKKKHCQEPVAAPASVSASVPAPVHVTADLDDAPAPAPLTVPVPSPALAPNSAQTELGPDTKEGQSERQQKQVQEEQSRTQTQTQPHEQQHDQQQQTQQPTTRNHSASPDTSSSVFDNSAADTEQNTTMLTEPDADQHARVLPPPRPRKLLTREEARQKARILRLKLGLANYKLQTGQEDVPLEKLEVKPVPGQERKRALPRVMVQPPSSRDGPTDRDAETRAQREDTESVEEPLNLDQTAGACGGVANSLLSLARASTSVEASSS